MPKLRFCLALALTVWVALEIFSWVATIAYDLAAR